MRSVCNYLWDVYNNLVARNIPNRCSITKSISPSLNVHRNCGSSMLKQWKSYPFLEMKSSYVKINFYLSSRFQWYAITLFHYLQIRFHSKGQYLYHCGRFSLIISTFVGCTFIGILPNLFFSFFSFNSWLETSSSTLLTNQCLRDSIVFLVARCTASKICYHLVFFTVPRLTLDPVFERSVFALTIRQTETTILIINLTFFSKSLHTF